MNPFNQAVGLLPSLSEQELRDLNKRVINELKNKSEVKGVQIKQQMKVGDDIRILYKGRVEEYKVVKINISKFVGHPPNNQFKEFTIPFNMVTHINGKEINDHGRQAITSNT